MKLRLGDSASANQRVINQVIHPDVLKTCQLFMGKTALVTVTAHGIGFAIAEACAKAGTKIAFNCSSQASLEKGMASTISSATASGRVTSPPPRPRL